MMKERYKINKARSAMRFVLLGLALVVCMVGIQYQKKSSYLVFAEAENLQPSPGQAFVSPLMPVNDGLDQAIESQLVDVGKSSPGVVLFDLTIDQDKDGLPDQLVVELKQRMTQGQPAAASLAAAPSSGKADDFYWRLPYTPQTRQLQAKAAKVIQYSTKVKSAEEHEKIAKRLRLLDEQMMQDPNYALVMKTFQTLLDQEMQKRLNPAARASSQTVAQGAVTAASPLQDVCAKVYLPAIFGTPRIDYTNLKRGDILLVDNGSKFTSFLYAMRWSHSGTYDATATNSFASVYEANTDGVRLRPLTHWQELGKFVGLSYNNRITNTQAQYALNWAKGKWGTDGRTPYNYNLADKQTDASLYCSQLVWKINMLNGIDLDSNNQFYLDYINSKWGAAGVAIVQPGIAPDEVGLSPNITMYAAGYNIDPNVGI